MFNQQLVYYVGSTAVGKYSKDIRAAAMCGGMDALRVLGLATAGSGVA
jgi:hypothetical protein